MIEVTTLYATDVADLSEAWAFVMEYVDRVGPSPTISIRPVWTPSDDPDNHERHFEVEVLGTAEVQDDHE